MRRIAAILALVASNALAQNDAGLVWAALYPGTCASNAVHNIANTGIVGNTRGPIQDLNRGIASNSTATAAWIGAGTNVYPVRGAGELTLSVWIKAVGTLPATGIMGNQFSTGTTGTYYLASATGTRLSFYAQSFATNYVGFDKANLPNLITSNWIHLAATWVGARTNTQLWINGENMTATTTRVGTNITSLQPCDNELRVGAYANGVNSVITSGRSLTMARLYNRALGTNEIKELYLRERAMLP
jgi:hypothetical protein